MPAIVAENISKHWLTPSGAMRAIDGISFAVEPGTLTVLLGPSGCGKSTTLRLLAGLEAADGGRILIDGRDVTTLPPAKRNIAMVFQSYALFPHLSVAENILFGLKVRGVGRAERNARLQRVASLLGLDTLLEHRPSQLSGGQQQRVALGRAIIAEAPVCLMDEPLSNLDAQLRQEMRQEIRELQQRLAITMVYVTHDQVEAMSMGDRIILLNAGRIEQNATPADLYEEPATLFAARFIGTPPMNILSFSPASATANAVVIAGTDGPLWFGVDPADTCLGVRPEHLRLDVHEGVQIGVPATVAAIEYLGADTLLLCRVGTERAAVRVSGRVGLRPGEATRLLWSRGAELFFSRRSGARLPREEERRDRIGTGATLYA